MATELTEDVASGGQPRAAVLLVVGEPFSDGDKTLILEEIVKGFRGWDCEATGVDINDELAQIANRAALGEEGPNGERLIRHRSDNLAIEVLINPQSQTVKDSLKAILTQLSPAKAIIYAGYAFQGTAAWVVQDELFTFAAFNQVFRDPNVENALKQVEGASLMLCSVSPSDWSSALKGSDVERLMRVSVNPKSKVENSHGLVQFSAYISNFIRAVPLGSMLQASDVIGNISFSRPVLYIFPGHQGDAALFGMKGFNMLVNGGYSRRSCFWDFVRHLDGIDALLLTHLGPDNLFGIKAVLERKSADTIHPDIDYMYMNTGKATNGIKAVANGDASSTDGDLVINLAAEGGRLLELSRKLGHTPHPLTRPLSGNLEPINLFHKVGKGSLDMYVLNPVGDAKEMKDFLTQWGKQAPSFSQANGVPIPNCTSICVLLVVRPASPTEKVTRILFPGSAPQHKLLEGLERVKHLEFLKHPTFCTQDMHKPKKASAAGNGRAGSATRRPPSAVTSRTTTSIKPEPPKRLETKASVPRVAAALPASAKAAKLQKDSNNKRASSAKDKEKVKLDEKEKEDKSKSSASSSPSKASVKTASPAKSPCSPTKTPATNSPDDILEIAASPAALSQTLISEAAVKEPLHPDSLQVQDNHLSQSLSSPGSADLMKQVPVNPEPIPADDNRMAESPEALPEPEHYGSNVDFGLQQGANTAMTEREKLQELGIYDDDDEGVDNGFDDKENGGMFGASGSPEADDEDVQPQPLPEPVAAVETPTGVEPDLIHDTFAKPSAMEQSQIFEDGIEPDYGADARDSSPATDSQVQEMLEVEPVDLPQASSLKQEEMEEAVPPAEGGSLTADAPSSPEPEREDPKGFPITDHLKETIPAAEEPSFCDKEPSADPEEPGCVDDLKEAGPALEEPSFNEENEAAENSNAIEQSIQYGVTNDNSFQMGGIREEEEEEVAAEKEEVKRLDEVPAELREEKHHLGVCDDQGQDEEEAGDAADSEKDAYVYEKDVNLEDEEVCMAGVTHDASEDLAMDREELAMDRGELAVDRGELAVDRGELAMDREELAVDREELAVDRGELAVDRGELAVDRGELAVDRGELAVDRGELAMDRGELAVDRGELAVDRGELAVDRGELAVDRGELAVDRGELAMDRGELAMDREELAVDREELAVDRGELAVDRGELAVDRGELAMDREELAVDRGEEQELQREGLAQDSEAEQDQQSSNIPEAFEKDESPTPVEKLVAAEIEEGDDAAAGQEDSGREDTDSIDGGTPDDDKDIDEILAMQQQSQVVAEKENEEVDKPRPGQEEGHNFNPFIGLGTPNPPADPADAQFDPLAQWGPPTGLPAPTPLHKVGEGDTGEVQEVTVLGMQEYLGQEAVSGQEVAGGPEEGPCTEGVGEHSPAVQGLAAPPQDDQIGTAHDGEGEDAAGTEKLSEADPTEFDPLAEWGQPMGLPSPPPPEVDSKSSAARSGGGDAKKADPKKARGKTGLEKRPTSGTKSPAKPANGTTEAPKTTRSKADPKKASLDTSRSARPASSRSLDTSKIESKTRPTTTTTTRRVASATTKARASPDVVKMPPLPPFTPFYMDLTYIPNHGELAYVDSEFFKRVRARYYVLSARNPNPKVLELLMDAKATWDKAGEQEVTVIPTYETPILQHWMAVHKERLAENKIDIAPAASRCTVRLQDHEDSCYTYRLEF